MDKFFDMIDLGENIKRGLDAIWDLRGIPALIMGVALGVVACMFGLLAWHFDLQPTMVWSDIAATKLAPTFGGALTEYAPLFIFTLTLLPSLIELFTVRFARANIAMAQWMVYAFVLFDWVTDWPAAADFVNAYASAFSRLGLLAGPLLFVGKVLWLLLASFGFEMLAIVFAVCALLLLLDVRGGHRARLSQRSGQHGARAIAA